MDHHMPTVTFVWNLVKIHLHPNHMQRGLDEFLDRQFQLKTQGLLIGPGKWRHNLGRLMTAPWTCLWSIREWNEMAVTLRQGGPSTLASLFKIKRPTGWRENKWPSSLSLLANIVLNQSDKQSGLVDSPPRNTWGQKLISRAESLQRSVQVMRWTREWPSKGPHISSHHRGNT